VASSKKATPEGVAFLPYSKIELDSLNVLSLPALGSLDHVELNALTLLKGAEAVRLDCAVVNENVISALTADESKTLSIVEPLNCSLFHCIHVPLKQCTAERIVGVLRVEQYCRNKQEDQNYSTTKASVPLPDRLASITGKESFARFTARTVTLDSTAFPAHRRFITWHDLPDFSVF
jgi:hypothetical protein